MSIMLYNDPQLVLSLWSPIANIPRLTIQNGCLNQFTVHIAAFGAWNIRSCALGKRRAPQCKTAAGWIRFYDRPHVAWLPIMELCIWGWPFVCWFLYVPLLLQVLQAHCLLLGWVVAPQTRYCRDNHTALQPSVNPYRIHEWIPMCTTESNMLTYHWWVVINPSWTHTVGKRPAAKFPSGLRPFDNGLYGEPVCTPTIAEPPKWTWHSMKSVSALI